MVEIDIGLQLLSPGKAFFTCDSSVLCAPGKCSAICLLWYRGRPVAAAPCTPGLRPAKSPLRGAFDFSLQAAGRAEAASLQNTALSPHPCGLPRPSGNVSAILRPPAPAVSAAPAPAMIWICRGCRPGKASAATRQKNRRTFSMPLRRHFLRPSGKTDKQAGKSKQTPRRRWLVA